MGNGVRAIPLKRARGSTARTTASDGTARWQAFLATGFEPALGSARPLWLATLGAGALAVRAVAVAWERLVVEGERAEADLRALLRPSTAAE